MKRDTLESTCSTSCETTHSTDPHLQHLKKESGENPDLQVSNNTIESIPQSLDETIEGAASALSRAWRPHTPNDQNNGGEEGGRGVAKHGIGLRREDIQRNDSGEETFNTEEGILRTKTGQNRKRRALRENLKITSREITACYWVCTHGAMSTDQIWRAVYGHESTATSSYARQRLHLLEKHGFLSVLSNRYNKLKYFQATKLAWELASTHFNNVPLSPVLPTQLLHLSAVTDIHIALCRANKLQAFKSDRQLAIDPYFPRKHFGAFIPDAIWVTPSGRRLLLEYERTRKAPGRIRKKAFFLSQELKRSDRQADLVLWIATPAAYQTVSRILSIFPEQHLLTFEELMAQIEAPLDPKK